MIMRTYHFMPTEFALIAIRDQRLKVARVNELNDPLDFYVTAFTDQSQRERCPDYLSDIADHYGIIGFSNNFSNPALWSRYADRHRGVALQFDIQSEDIHLVRYSIDSCTMDRDSALTDKAIRQLLSMNFPQWQYENEARVICRLKDCATRAYENGRLYFKSMTDRMRLVGLIRGAACDLKDHEISSQLFAEEVLTISDAAWDAQAGGIFCDNVHSVSGGRSYAPCCYKV